MNFELGDIVTFIPYNKLEHKNRLGVIIEIRENKLYRYRVKWMDSDMNDEQFTYEASELIKL